MIDLTKKKMPEAVSVDGIFYKIKTDFRYWLIVMRIIKQEALASDFDFLYIDEMPEDKQAGVKALIDFCFAKNSVPRVVVEEDTDAVFDYDIDADLIYAAFYEQYTIDLISIDMHWHVFRALFSSLHDTKFDTVIGYRQYTPTNEKHETYMQRMKRTWELPSETTDEEQEALERFDALVKD